MSTPLRKVQILFCAVLAAVSAGADTGPAGTARADYDRLQQWNFGGEPIAVPAEGVRWAIDTASWELETGRIWLQEPTSDGRVTGLVFEGQGRFRMGVPDPFELAQLRRFVEEPELEEMDHEFSHLVLRFAGQTTVPTVWPSPTSSFRSNSLARERHDHWLRMRRLDADAGVVWALMNPSAQYIRADMKTSRVGWLTYEYDSRQLEEIRLEKFQKKNSFLEHWLGLDRPEDRLPNGRPGGKWRPPVDIQHVEIKADLTKPGKNPRTGVSLSHPFVGRFDTRIRFENLVEGARAVQLYLYTGGKVTRVSDENGLDLPFLRDHIGGRSGGIDKRIYDFSLVVLLDEPLRRGEVQTLRFEYEIELDGYGPGRFWYPAAHTASVGLRDFHTGRLEFTSRERHTVRAMGALEEEWVEGGLRTSIWRVEKPAKMMTFTLVTRLHENRKEMETGPDLVAFGSLNGYLSEEKIGEVATEVGKSMSFFQQLFDTELQVEELYATLIPAGHGQAFDGYLHLGDLITIDRQSGVRERFLAHEVAHQWWGHLVGWAGYRDQWLSESFAEYSAMMYVQQNLERGEKLFEEMLQVYTDELNGSIKTMYSGFTRPGLPLLNRAGAERVGPIGHGYRCATADAPKAYLSQAYRKGALVLHMLRVLLEELSGNDEAFSDFLREVIRQHRGRLITTQDVEDILAHDYPGDWSGFFDQWIYRAEIPTYDWHYEVAPAPTEEGIWLVVLEIRQGSASENYRMPVPVAVEFADGRQDRSLVWIDGKEERFELRFKEQPRKVVFNPDHAVLAKVNRRR